MMVSNVYVLKRFMFLLQTILITGNHIGSGSDYMLTFQVLTLEVMPMIVSDFQMAAWPRGLHIPVVTGLVICPPLDVRFCLVIKSRFL